MKKRIKRGKSTILILTAIVLLAFFFRFYKLHEWVFFGMDQEYEALIVKNILTGKHLPLIGVNAGDTGVYLGPVFVYLAAVPFALFSGNPFGWALTASALGVIVSYLIYKIAKEMFSERVGIFASLFYAGSFLTSFYDRKFWNPTLVPLFSLLIGYLLFQILNKRKGKIVWLAFVFGLAIQSHLSMLIFVPLIFYALWVRKRELSRKIIFLSLIIFLLLQGPLILFELRHNFLNSKAVVNLILGKSGQQASFSTLIERNTLFLSSLGRLFWVPLKPDLFLESGQCWQLSMFRRDAYPEGVLLVLIGVAIFGWWHFHKQRGRLRWKISRSEFTYSSKIIAGIFLLALIFIELYNRAFFEYYLLFFFPWLTIALGWSTDFIWQNKHGRLIITPVIFLFIVLNLLTLFTSSFSYSYKDKIAAINFAKKYIQGDDYSLEALGECPRFGGYRYLFEYFVGVPIYSYMDSYFAWLYPDKIFDRRPVKTVLLSMIDSRDRAESIAKWEEIKLRFLEELDIVAEKKFDRIKVFILTPPTTAYER